MKLIWGDGWRMPTYEEQEELRTKCTWTWITTDVKDASDKFIEGYNVVGPSGESIFLPASGDRLGSSLYDVGSWGHYWSSSLLASGSSSAYYLLFDSDGYDWGSNGRFYGFSVRPQN